MAGLESSMEYAKLGNTDIEVSKLCVGCMSFGKAGTMHDWTLDEQQIALAWEWSKGVTAPIIGATKASHFDDAVGAFHVKLTQEDIAYLEEPYVPHKIIGAINQNPNL